MYLLYKRVRVRVHRACMFERAFVRALIVYKSDNVFGSYLIQRISNLPVADLLCLSFLCAHFPILNMSQGHNYRFGFVQHVI